VRIIGGAWRRLRLPVPAVPGLRPTPDRVRETLFNWLGQDLTGWRVLDAFAGSGALGFEAASRGAAEVVLLERDAALLRALRASRERLQATQVLIEAADALQWMAGPGRPSGHFHLVLLDPPFGADLFARALRAATPLLAPGGAIYLEADHPFKAAELAPLGLQVHRCGHAGKVCFHLLRPAGPGPGE
jgi:16S rRNA (guanine966-N2)-methyltransferase